LKLLLCDDHALFREGLRHVLEGLGEGYELIEASGAPEALAAAEADPDLDLILLDLHLPGVTGFEALRALRESAPTVPVVMLSAAEEPEAMREALEHGAAGWVPKSSTGPVLRAALQLVLDGGIYVPHQALAAPAAPPKEPESPLTPRQRQVAEFLMLGKTNKEICSELDMAEGTCKTHLAAIFETLDVTNRTEAAAALRELGITPRRRSIR
jgi:DNA-binding NarL/FixJ family response regulator